MSRVTIKRIKVDDHYIELVRIWHKTSNPKYRRQMCPFHLTEYGGDICLKAFHKCKYRPNQFKVNPGRGCNTYPCPCEIYTMDFVMKQAMRIMKYRRI